VGGRGGHGKKNTNCCVALKGGGGVVNPGEEYGGGGLDLGCLDSKKGVSVPTGPVAEKAQEEGLEALLKETLEEGRTGQDKSDQE